MLIWPIQFKGFEDKIVKVATVNKDMMESVVTTSNTNQAEITESNLNHEQWLRLRRVARTLNNLQCYHQKGA